MYARCIQCIYGAPLLILAKSMYYKITTIVILLDSGSFEHFEENLLAKSGLQIIRYFCHTSRYKSH